MRKIWCFWVVLCGFSVMKAQKDSIFASVKVIDEQYIKVKQRIVYHHPLDKPLSKIKLLNWVAAYKRKGTPLSQRKLEDGETNLHFAKENDLGEILDLKIHLEDKEISNIDFNQENIYLPVSQFIESGDKREILLNYTLKLPKSDFTFYGRKSREIALKYFFLVPDTFEDEGQKPKFFRNLEETQNTNSFWKVDFALPENYFAKSNLDTKDGIHFYGNPQTDVEFYLTKNNPKSFEIEIGGSKTKIELAYTISKQEEESLEFYLPLHLQFIKDRLGWLPEKILITPKQKKYMSFLGNEDIRLWNRRLPLYTSSEKVDLDYFALITHNVLEKIFIADKNKEHWLKNGLKSYLEAQYLKRFYKNHPLVGNIKDWSILGLKPFKWFNVSKLNLTDRYGVAYQYAMRRNVDQAIGESWDNLKTENHTVTQFEMGALLDFISEKEGKDNFDGFIKSYISKNQGGKIQSERFLDDLELSFGDKYSFVRHFVQKKQRLDLVLKSIHQISEDIYSVKISKNTPLNIPFKLEVKDQQGQSQFFWLDTDKDRGEAEFKLQLNHPKKLIINPNYGFLESNFRNNFSERKWFGFAKKVKFKLFTDIPNPEYNEVYLNPDIRYNIYDELLLGLNFSNSSLMSPPFSYSVTPFVSIGEWRLTGTGGISYKIQPVDAFFRNITLGVSGAYFHYNHNLAYRKISLFSAMDFAKNPRSMIDKSVRLSYQYIDRDISENIDYSKNYKYYGIWTFAGYLRDKNPIYEKFLTTKFQWMRDFQKISVEGIYYWTFAPKKQAQFRVYGGLFLENKARNRAFDFGISKINDYNFSYSLLGQSAVSGLYAQEFILAEGGFKSYVGGRANRWLVAVNADVPIWKMFSVYGDVGAYKNKTFAPKFIWDSGVKVSVLPSVLEVYFPIQSSLGFEPTLGHYNRRIRFSLNLDVNSFVRAIKKFKM